MLKHAQGSAAPRNQGQRPWPIPACGGRRPVNGPPDRSPDWGRNGDTGEAPPAPARQGVRTEQVNVRLTQEEKALLETSAKQKGFRGLSDFVRAGAMAFTK